MPEAPNVIFPIESWSVTETSFSLGANYRNETTFALSNGYLGTRGTQDECMALEVDTGLEGNFINGFYDSETIRYGEWNFGFPTRSQSLLNLPNPKKILLTADGETLDLRQCDVTEYRRRLDLRDGAVSRTLLWTTRTGRRFRVESERFCSLDDKNVLAIRYAVTPLENGAAVEILSILDADVENHTRKTNPLVDYGPFGRRVSQEQMEARGNELYYQGVTQGTGLHVACGISHTLLARGAETACQAEAMCGQISFTVPAAAEERIELCKYVAFTSSIDMETDAMRAFVHDKLATCVQQGYGVLRRAHTGHMHAFWETADVQIDGDEAAQQGIRFNLFHIMQAAGRDGRTGMGAKGLTGEGYEGHYFWDTETYVLPVFTHTCPKLAKGLLMYRYRTLPQARARARVLGHLTGALYPWRTINGEEASTYFPLGTAQYHINGDIAHAVWQYVEATGDNAFLRDFGCEMLCEIARVWADVGCFSEARDGKYCICSVTGPDEYNAIVDNNFYTNLLAQENLRNALKAINILEQEEPEAGRALLARLEITGDEQALWRRVADEMYLPHDGVRGVYLQDDGFLLRKPWDDSRIPPGKRHLLYENFHPLFVYRQRMCKQADAILGLHLFSARFTAEELRRNYDFYQSVTLHHSSLSTSVFGMLACRVGYAQQAYDYFCQSARMDLDDCHRNVYAGIHAANMAGTWLNIVQGFAGLRVKDGLIEFSPLLPEAWEGYRFRLLWRGARLKVAVDRKGVCIKLEEGQALDLLYRGWPRALREGESIHEAL